MWHNGLISKLKSKGVDGKALGLLGCVTICQTVKSVLSLAGQASEAIPINASVLQGSVLGPLLFSIYIDDLVDVCENELSLYADDSTLQTVPPNQLKSLRRDLSNIKSLG